MPETTEYEFDLKKWNALLSKAKAILLTQPEKLEYRKNQSEIHKEIRRKCQYKTHSLTRAHSKENILRLKKPLPSCVSYILCEFRRAMLHHDWGRAKQLLRAIVKSTSNHRIAWTSLTTALAHTPGSLPLLRDFLEEYKDQLFSGETINALLTIKGMQTCKMYLRHGDDASDEDENAVDTPWSDSETEDSVFDDSSNFDTVSKD